MKQGALRLFLAALSAAALAGCSGKSVERVAPDTTVDLSGYWNDTDSRLVSEAMISDVLGAPWYTTYTQGHPDKPTVIVGTIRNETSEHIAVGTFIGDIERAFVNSQKVRVVATADEREEIRDERTDQGTYASDETIKKFGQEHGADYMLIGNVNSIIDQKSGDEVRYYQVDMTLVDIATNEKTWIGQHQIKKLVGRSAYKS
jgi:penicillin-binding protein activator